MNQTRLGPISGSRVTLYKATQEHNSNREMLYEGITTISNKINEAGTIYLPVPYPQQTVLSEEEQNFMDAIAGYEGDFILEVSGGFDIDSNDDFNVDSRFTQVNGKLHLILSKEKLLQNDYKVNILTEIGYQLSRDLLGDNYDKARLQERLDDIAKRIFIEKLYPDASQPLGRNDLYYWVPMAHKNWLIKPYDMTLDPIVQKVYGGKNIYADAYDYVYGEIDSELTTVPIVKSQWFKVDENLISGSLIGHISLVSEGNTSVESYTLSGDGSEYFRVEDNGEVYLEDNATLDFETTQIHQLQLVVNNATGASKPVTLYIIVNNILDVPEDRSFTGGIIPEDAPVGMVVGQLVFDPGAAPIEHIKISGEDQADFTVELNGTIRVSENASFDYETRYSRNITLQAFNSYGGSRVVPISFAITDAVDVPIIQTLDVFLDENAISGYEVGQMTILSDVPLESIVLEGGAKEDFWIDLNGTVKVANGASLDYETRANYVFTVIATNALGTSMPGVLVIRLNDISDAPLLNHTYLHMIERSPLGTEIGQVLIETNGSSPIIDFALTGDGIENFEIDQNGMILVANDSLNRSDQEYFEFFAAASNSAGKSLKVLVVIHIDTQRPILNILNSYIYEDAEEGTSVGMLPILSSAFPITTFHLEGIGSEKFTIDLNGSIRLADGVSLDYEETTNYTFSVTATNKAGQSDPVPLYIRVVDRVDTLEISGFSMTIYEDVPEDTTVGYITTISSGGKVIDHYELNGTGSEKFTVLNDGTIKIKAGAKFDATNEPKYHISLVAVDTDGVNSNQVFIDISVVKSIDSIPQINDMVITVKEDTPVGTVLDYAMIISKVQVVEYAWLEGEGSDFFDLRIDGAITLKKPLDYEIKSGYTLTIFAKNSLGQSQGATLSVVVSNVIDDEPVLNDASFSIQENTVAGTEVGTVQAQSTGTSPIERMRLSGVGAGLFSIDSNGTVRVIQSVDYESKKVYNLQAIATNAKADSPEASVTINVSNIPEHPPILYDFKGFVEDNATAGTIIGEVEFASRGDSLVNGFVLTGEGKENFKIDINGTLSLSDDLELDEITQKIYNLSLVALNSAGGSTPANAEIVLTHDKVKPYKPSSLKLLDIGHNSITLGWVDNAQNERGFNLYIDGVKHATLGANTTSYRVTGLEEEISYIFTLKSFNDRGESQGLSIVGITDIDRSEYLKAILGQKCGVSASNFDRYFNADTGYYNSGIYCSSKGLTDKDLLNFKALKSIRYDLRLDRNNFTNADGLSNLKSVGRNFYVYNNQLTNVDGLNKLTSVGSYFRLDGNQLTNVNGLNSLTSVGSYFYLNNNQLTNVNGLSSLTSVGQYFYLQDNLLTNADGLSSLSNVGNHFYLHRNALTNIDGLSSLVRVGGNFNVESNQLTNLDSLSNLTTVGGYFAMHNNPNLTDVSGAENIVGAYGKLLYLDLGQYTIKADGNSSLCSATWDLRDPSGNIADDMSQVCDGQAPYVPEDKEKLRDVLESKCGVTTASFDSYFNADTGHYSQPIYCSSRGLTDMDLLNFKALKSIGSHLRLDRNNLTNVDGLSNLKSVGGQFYLYNNQLTNVDGLSKLETASSYFRLDGNQLTNLNFRI